MCNIHVYPEDMFRKFRRVILNLVEADRYIKLRFIIRDKNCLFTTLLNGIYMLIICFRYYIVHTLRGWLTLSENTFELGEGNKLKSIKIQLSSPLKTLFRLKSKQNDLNFQSAILPRSFLYHNYMVLNLKVCKPASFLTNRTLLNLKICACNKYSILEFQLFVLYSGYRDWGTPAQYLAL